MGVRVPAAIVKSSARMWKARMRAGRETAALASATTVSIRARTAGCVAGSGPGSRPSRPAQAVISSVSRVIRATGYGRRSPIRTARET